MYAPHTTICLHHIEPYVCNAYNHMYAPLTTICMHHTIICMHHILHQTQPYVCTTYYHMYAPYTTICMHHTTICLHHTLPYVCTAYNHTYAPVCLPVAKNTAINLNAGPGPRYTIHTIHHGIQNKLYLRTLPGSFKPFVIWDNVMHCLNME